MTGTVCIRTESRNTTCAALLAAAVAAGTGGFFATSAQAATITLFNTGVDAGNAVLPDGTVGDPHYSLVSVPGGSTQLLIRAAAGGFPVQPSGPWLGDDALSTWIGPDNNGTLGQTSGTYDFQTTFTLATAGTVNIAGEWAAATGGTGILLNGINEGVAAMPLPGYVGFTPFSINDSGLAGLNTLDFLVNNVGGPTGLRVEFTSATANPAVPEPATLAVLGLGVLGLLGRRRRA